MQTYLQDSDFQMPLSTGHCSIDNLPNVFAHIRLLHINARDIRAGDKFLEIEDIAVSGLLDVVCISETFLSADDPKLYNFHGFHHYSIVREKRGGGGVSIYVHESFSVCEVEKFSTEDETVQAIRCKIRRRDVCCYVLAFYANNRSQYECLIELLDMAIANLALPVFALGDSNINTLNLDRVSSQYMSFLSSKALLPAIEGVTRLESGTCLDHIFLPVGHVAAAYSRVIELDSISDHSPVWAAVCLNVMDTNNSQVLQPHIQRRIFSSKNFYNFYHTLATTDFSACTQTNCVDTALHCLESTLFTVYDSNFPVRNFQPAKPSLNLLFPDSLKRLRRQVDRLRRKYSSDKSNLLNKFYYYAGLKFYRLKRRRLCADLINDNLAAKNSAQSWRFLKRVLGQDKTRGGPTELLVDGVRITDIDEMAEEFATQFAGIGEAVSRTLGVTTTVDLGALLPHRPLYRPFKFETISAYALSNAAMQINTNFAGPLNGIPSRVLKQSLPFILDPLLHILNLSLKSGVVPMGFKRATVIPLYKSRGSKTDTTNYRPISLCPYLAKLFEKCISLQLYSYLNSIDFFSQTQFGFIRNKSTDIALCDLYNRLTQLSRDGSAALCAFLDVAKAFDSVSPVILDKILSMLDFDSLSRKWVLSYLSDRRIVVKIGHCTSAERSINLGVPQGSSLGPLLFIIYINVILRYIESRQNLGACCYADDLTIFRAINKTSAENDIKDFENELKLLGDVYNSLNLVLNVHKTEVILFKNVHSRVATEDERVQFGGSVVRLSTRARYLGISFSENLRWLDHFHEMSKRCFRIIAILSRLNRSGVSLTALIYFYKALFIPVLSYGIVLWGSSFDTHLRQVEVLQRDAIRAIFGLSRRSGVYQLMQQNKLMSVKQLYLYKVASLVFSQMAVHGSHYSRQYIYRPPPHYPLRHYEAQDIALYRECTEYCKRAPLYQHGRVWNEVPGSIRCAPSLKAFQRRLQQHLLNVAS